MTTFNSEPIGLVIPMTLLAALVTTVLHGASYFFYWRVQYLEGSIRAEGNDVPMPLYACAASVLFLFTVINIHSLRVFHQVLSTPPSSIRLRNAKVCMGFLGLATALLPCWAAEISLFVSALYSPRSSNALLAEIAFALETVVLAFTLWYPWTVSVADYFQRGVRRAADRDMQMAALMPWQRDSVSFTAQYALEAASRKRRMSPSPLPSRV